MPLDPTLIYQRTSAGTSEVYDKSLALEPSDRLVLMLIDGRISNEGLLTRMPGVGGEAIADSLSRLLRDGLVEVAGARSTPGSGFEGTPGTGPRRPHGPAREADVEKYRMSTLVAQVEEESDAAEAGAGAGRQPRAARPARVPEPRDGAAPTAIVTQFAITSVNVPDALDLQEERDRAEWSAALQARRRQRLKSWGWRGGAALLGMLVLGLVLGWWRPLPSALSAPALSASLGQALGRPVEVASTELVLAPAPELILEGVVFDGRVRADEIRVRASWAEFWRGLRDGAWSWGEARISPMELPPEQALALGQALLARGDRLPERISTLRFESVAVSDARLLPGRFEVVARRGADGRFGRLAIRQIDSGDTKLEISVTGATAGAPLVFELEASAYALPFGPAVRWNEVRASGILGPGSVRISHYSLAGFYGVVTGSVLASRDQEWAIEGTSEVAGLDLEALLLRNREEGGGGAARIVPFQGIANADLSISGQGASLDGAVGAARVAGAFQVRWATLNRVNLGAFAVQASGLGGGMTRFTEFDGQIRADRYGINLIGVGGRAGAMAARGDVGIGPNDELRGLVRVELGGATVHAPVTVQLRGTLLDPRFVE